MFPNIFRKSLPRLLQNIFLGCQKEYFLWFHAEIFPICSWSSSKNYFGRSFQNYFKVSSVISLSWSRDDIVKVSSRNIARFLQNFFRVFLPENVSWSSTRLFFEEYSILVLSEFCPTGIICRNLSEKSQFFSRFLPKFLSGFLQ